MYKFNIGSPSLSDQRACSHPNPMSKPKYPTFYEKAIPIALAALGVLALVLLVVIAVVLFSA